MSLFSDRDMEAARLAMKWLAYDARHGNADAAEKFRACQEEVAGGHWERIIRIARSK